MSDLESAITAVIADIDQYYDYSFRISPEKCAPLVLLLIQHIEDVYPTLTKNQTTKLNSILQKIVEAMEAKDYVRMRDYLHYDLRVSLLSFQTKSQKEKVKSSKLH